LFFFLLLVWRYRVGWLLGCVGCCVGGGGGGGVVV